MFFHAVPAFFLQATPASVNDEARWPAPEIMDGLGRGAEKEIYKTGVCACRTDICWVLSAGMGSLTDEIPDPAR